MDLFHKKHNKNETEFYFDLVSNLIKDRLTIEDNFYQILLANRNKTTQLNLKEAIENALIIDNNKRVKSLVINYNSEIVRSKDTPELSIVDYMLWVLQRYINTSDKRFYKVLESKFNVIIDLYDFDKKKTEENLIYYDCNNLFDLEKVSEFKANGYI